MTSSSYTAEIDPPKPSAPCSCNGGCDWTGPAKDTVDIDDCVLTPGDGSPVGRCPKCGTLAYLDEPNKWTKAVAAATFDDAVDGLRKALNIPFSRATDEHVGKIAWPPLTATSGVHERLEILSHWLRLPTLQALNKANNPKRKENRKKR